MQLAIPGSTPTTDRVIDAQLTTDNGLFNPYTLSGSIVVDSVLASCHSSSALDGLFSTLHVPLPAGYQAAFAPFRALYRLVGPSGAEFLQATLGVVLLALANGEVTAPALVAMVATALVTSMVHCSWASSVSRHT